MAMTKESAPEKKILIVAFSLIKQYPKKQLEDICVNQKQSYICSPYDWIHLSWKPHHVLRRLVKKRDNNNQTSEEGWATATKLKNYIQNQLGIKSSVIEPNGFYYFLFPLTLFWALTKWKAIRANLLGQRTNIYIEGIESTGYFLDSLMRYNSEFRIENEASWKNVSTSIVTLAKFKIYFSWFKKNSRKNRCDEILINHNVYLESGWLASFMHEMYRAKIIHYKHILLSPTELIYPRDRWLNQVINGQSIHFDRNDTYNVSNAEFQTPIIEPSTKQLPWFDSKSIANLNNNKPLKINCKKYLIVMHAFTDANNIHEIYGEEPLFPSYYHWIKETLKIAQNNPNFDYVFRIHPGTFKFYPKDIGIIQKLFSTQKDNITLEDPRESNSFNPDEELPIVVTYQGSITLECSMIGYKTINLGFPASPVGSYIKPQSLTEYINLLSNMQNPRKFVMEKPTIMEAQIWKQKLIESFHSK